jgi:hypothetical protein
MRRIATFLTAAGAAIGIGSIGTASSVEAGYYCPPVAYTVVYYGPPPCCYGYGYYGYGHGYRFSAYYYSDSPYYKTTQYWPMRIVRPARVKLYGPIRARRR